mmetsp:Transcript_46177/g.145285  ORF Transcript_46177/g.145285 Transcript_46177/m.145285 type:complete len:266 (-) Transcript_46177:664-1461(-)
MQHIQAQRKTSSGCVLVTDSRLWLRATTPSSEYCVLSDSLVGRLHAVEGEDALQHDGRRHVDVERVHPVQRLDLHGGRHRDAHALISEPRRRLADALILCPNHHRQRHAAEWRRAGGRGCPAVCAERGGVLDRALKVQGEQSVASSLDLQERLGPVRRERVRQLEDGAHRRADRLAVERVRAARREHDARDAEGEGRTEERAHVLGLDDAVEQQQRRPPHPCCGRERGEPRREGHGGGRAERDAEDRERRVLEAGRRGQVSSRAA